jgi:putative membrane protein
MTGGRPQEWIPYCGAAPDPGDLWTRWNLDPALLIALAVIATVLAVTKGVEPGRRAFAGSAFALLLLLFVSPFCALTSALFSARVVHHVLLTAALAPLLVLSFDRERTAVSGPLAFWTGLQALIFWSWHVPLLYAIALSNDGVYWLMQLSILGSAFGFWASVRRAAAPAAVAALLVTMVQMGLLGALLTFTGKPLYEPHFASAIRWGFDPLEDQQLGGLVMWVPSAAIYLVAALFIANRWLSREARIAG